MSENKIVKAIKVDLEHLKEDGQKEVNINVLINYLDKLNDDNIRERDVEIEAMKLENQAQLNLQQHNLATYLETFKVTITAGSNAVKALMLLNGGASVAFLAFIGNLWISGKMNDALPLLVNALTTFCYGVGLAVCCSGFTYFCQFLVQLNFIKDMKSLSISAHLMNALAVICGLISIILFFRGVHIASLLFR
ncbi:hypothetical protein ACFPZP_16135 [Citrobacter bitternis]|uniref:Fluoride ion transporter CrcB n=1 Tax=Citrobacter bitternis TaxID=1585982 RepID=A0ABW1Q360_9ENTR